MSHIRIILLALVIWGRGIRLQHQLLDGTLHKNGENTVLTLCGNLGQIGTDFPQPNKIISAFQQLVFQQTKHTRTCKKTFFGVVWCSTRKLVRVNNVMLHSGIMTFQCLCWRQNSATVNRCLHQILVQSYLYWLKRTCMVSCC